MRAASGITIPDNGVDNWIVRFLLYRYLTKKINIIIYKAGAAPLPYTIP